MVEIVCSNQDKRRKRITFTEDNQMNKIYLKLVLSPLKEFSEKKPRPVTKRNRYSMLVLFRTSSHEAYISSIKMEASRYLFVVFTNCVKNTKNLFLPSDRTPETEKKFQCVKNSERRIFFRKPFDIITWLAAQSVTNLKTLYNRN